jgi:hypothetical protein
LSACLREGNKMGMLEKGLLRGLRELYKEDKNIYSLPDIVMVIK